MKKRILSVVAAMALLLTMMPMAFSVTAETVANLTSGLVKREVQNFDSTAYEPWGANVWYNADLTNTPVVETGKGLYFSDAVSGNPRFSANIKIKSMVRTDISKAEYLVLTFGVNSLTMATNPYFTLQFGLTLGSDYVLANNTTVYYDNGADTLQETVVTGETFTRQMQFALGTASTVTAYIPVSAIVYAYDESVVASPDTLKTLSEIGLNFTNLGNGHDGNGWINDKDAVSVKDISMLVPLTAAELTEGLVSSTVQNFDNTAYEPWGDNVWYNADLTNTPVVETGKGLYFSDAVSGVAKTSARIQIKSLTNTNIAKAEYLVLTLGKNTVPVDADIRLTLQFILDGGDYVLANGTTVYYDNGAERLQLATVAGDTWAREMRFFAGSSATVTVYIPVSSIVNGWNESSVASAEALRAVQTIDLSFSDLGNKYHSSWLNDKDSVSIRDISVLGPYTGPEAVEWAPAGEKVVLQDFENLSGELSSVRDHWNEGNKLEVVDGAAQLVSRTDANHAYFFLSDISKKDWSAAEWLAMTVKVKSAPGTAANQTNRPGLFLALGAEYGGQAYSIFETVANSRYWVKDGVAYAMTKGGFDWGFYYEDADAGVAVGDTITVYVKVSDLAYQWGDANSKIADLTNISGVWMGLSYDTNGNSMVSVEEVALYNIPHDHQWSEATCATPKTCSVCGKTEGEPTYEHIYANGVCTGCAAAEAAEVSTFFGYAASVDKTALRFGFTMPVAGVVKGDAYAADLTNATITLGGVTYSVKEMGGIITNKADATLTFDGVDDSRVLKIPAAKVLEATESEASFAIGIKGIPEEYRSREISCRTYLTYQDGDHTVTIYSDIVTHSVQDYITAAGE